MKIAMVGSGAAGSVFASYLRAGGADMTLIDPYKAHMDAVRDHGMKFTIYPDKTTVLTGFHTAYSADEVETMDIVIFMTKANQLENAIVGAKHCIGPNTVLVSLINGLGNDDKLLKYYPASRCMVGSGVIGTALDGPGGCISTPSEGVIMNFGALENNELTMAAGKYMEECFNKGDCEAVFREDVLPFIWKKVTVNCTVNTVCAVTRLKIGYVENNPYGQKLFHNVIRECCAVAEHKGVHIDPDEFNNAISDETFQKIVAVLRVAVPYTGIIISTRESKRTREKVLDLGISQISGGSRTSVGGYAEEEPEEENSA